jgi:Uma2 family endonuclease
VPNEHISIITKQNIQGIPDLIIEIAEKRDRKEKFDLYQRFGVPEYWIVDPETDTVQVFRGRDCFYVSAGEFRGESPLESPILPGLSIPAREIFAI